MLARLSTQTGSTSATSRTRFQWASPAGSATGPIASSAPFPLCVTRCRSTRTFEEFRSTIPHRLDPLKKEAAMRSMVCLAALPLLLSAGPPAREAEKKPDSDRVMLTIFLRHDQAKTLEEINAHLDRTGFRAKFPPAGVEVVFWYVMMGIGQVVTLRFPASRLRDFYPTYDYRPVWEQSRAGAHP